MIALLCTDGSDPALDALRAGLGVLAPADRVVLATVIDAADPMLVAGTGMAAGVMSADELADSDAARRAEAEAMLTATASALGLGDVDARVLAGSAGHRICELAEQLPATVVLLGTRGRGGLRRALLGSVSDHVVRNAPCPVVTVGPA